MKNVWGHCGDIKNQFWGHSRDILGTFEIFILKFFMNWNLEKKVWGHCGNIKIAFWGHFRDIMGTLAIMKEVLMNIDEKLEICLGTLWEHQKSILGTFSGHHGNISKYE